MRFIETVACKLLHQIENFIGLGLHNAVLLSTRAEDTAMLGHLLGFFLTHRTAQQIRATERVAAQNLCSLHHLLLIDHDAVGLTQHIGHQRMRILNLLAPMLARHEAGNQVHRARAIQRVERNQIF